VVPNPKLHEVAHSVDLFQPWQLVAGVAARPFSRLLVTFDLTFSRWSEQPPSAANITLELDIGSFNEYAKLPPSRPYPPAGYHDTLMPAVGIEWRALAGALGDRLALDLRAGYRYEPSPVPEQPLESNLGDADRHIMSLGFGLELQRLTRVLPRPFSLDFFAALHHLPERRFRKLDPASAVGDFTVSGQVWQVGAQLRWRL
jgi:long-subunit fatty acid transport protein